MFSSKNIVAYFYIFKNFRQIQIYVKKHWDLNFKDNTTVSILFFIKSLLEAFKRHFQTMQLLELLQLLF